jgi:hypothetical protein
MRIRDSEQPQTGNLSSKKPSLDQRLFNLQKAVSQPIFVAWLALFLGGALVRLLLCLENPPLNAFDDHFTPIFLTMKLGAIPPKDAAFQCYHPPVFYAISAVLGKLAAGSGATQPQLMKLFQFVNCFYGIATVAVCGLILRKLPLSSFAKLLAFGTVCFLPRHIYMSAMHSNDTLSYLFAALSIYAAIIAFERRLAFAALMVLSVTLTLAIFTKYTAFAVLPSVFTAFAWACWVAPPRSRKRIVVAAVVTFVLPLLCLAAYIASNLRHYHAALPWNIAMYDPSAHRPRDPGGIN